jgi:hypothetical protein
MKAARATTRRLGRSTVKRVIVRYRVKPDRAAENVELVRAVYAELHDTGPAGTGRSSSRTA